MGGGTRHALQRGQLLGDKLGHLAQAASLHENQQIVAATHQKQAGDLVKFRNPFGDPIKPALALRLHLHLDVRLDQVAIHLVVINDGLVAENDFLLFVLPDPTLDFFRRQVQHPGQIVGRSQGVLLEQFQ
jgi:hypothetical protein